MPNEPALPVPTAQEIVETALRKGGVVGLDEAVEPGMLNDAFADANDLFAQWARNRYLIYRLADYAFVSTGALSYPVGLGQTVNINPRPDRLESAFLRLLNNPAGSNQFVDLPLDIIPSREDYNRITLKSLGLNAAGGVGTIAWRIFYDPVWPVGVLYPWPIPAATLYEIHVTFKEVLPRFANLQQKINLPPEYQPAMKWCLAEVLRASNQMPEDPQITKFARRALNSIRLANTAVPTLQMPDALRGSGGRAYDYHSDT